ncbi:LytR/AlgR family response regulator transcription factor [Alkalibacter saccharofermentans]|uniref:Stage 0 sporulation protein A homolog n=1 Tax=Alkalibacter saccharofermentans DSM 14828 TaxID=1120975 RepID=A0A1M4ZUM1_9FIRM|nr:response regulator transcription factor [Alkalibacter saccharofermentans]SHF21790.1 two component transcriptional regulator, LytTR family [Alkalibacter saccharofermentans DSM 14828]
MKRTKILVVERDLRTSLEIQRNIIDFGWMLAAAVESTEEALEFLNADRADLVLMDMEIPGSINTARLINESHHIPVVFLSGTWDEKTIINAAISTNAYGCVAKPVNDLDLKMSIALAIGKHRAESMPKQDESPKDPALEKLKKIAIWAGDEINLLEPDKMSFIEIRKGMLHFSADGEEYMQRGALNIWEKKLGHMGFYRCHKSFLINVSKIEKIIYNGCNSFSVKLKERSEPIPVSREKINELKKMMQI